LLAGVHFVESVGEAAGEGFEGLDQLEAARCIVDLGVDRVSLGAQRGFAAA